MRLRAASGERITDDDRESQTAVFGDANPLGSERLVDHVGAGSERVGIIDTECDVCELEATSNAGHTPKSGIDDRVLHLASEHARNDKHAGFDDTAPGSRLQPVGHTIGQAFQQREILPEELAPLLVEQAECPEGDLGGADRDTCVEPVTCTCDWMVCEHRTCRRIAHD